MDEWPLKRQVVGLRELSGQNYLKAIQMIEEKFLNMNGSTLGPSESLDRLGAGGMGEVFLANDPRLDRQVAIIKILPPAVAEDADRRNRFREGARAAAALNHLHTM